MRAPRAWLVVAVVATAATWLPAVAGAEQVLKHHDAQEGQLGGTKGAALSTGEIYAVRFDAPAYPATIVAVRVLMADGGDGDMADCGSWYLEVWDDPGNGTDPGELLLDTEQLGEGVTFELKEAIGLQQIPLDGKGDAPPPLTVTGPFRVGLRAAAKNCVFGPLQSNEYPVLYTDSDITPGVNFLYGAQCASPPCAGGGQWYRWEDVCIGQCGDFIMEVVLAGGTSGGCASAADCDDGDACTLDSCAGGACAHAPACDDGDPCTVDSCDAAACHHEPVPNCGQPEPSDAGPSDAGGGAAEPDAGSGPAAQPDGAGGSPSDAAAPAGALRLDKVVPNQAPADRAVTLSLLGAGFDANTRFRIGPASLVQVELQSDTAATGVLPAGALPPGVYSAFAERSGATAELPEAFVVLEPAAASDSSTSSGGCAASAPNPLRGVVFLAMLAALCAWVVRRRRSPAHRASTAAKGSGA